MPSLFEFASQKFRDNKLIAMIVIEKCPYFFNILSERLRDDVDIAKLLTRKNFKYLIHSSNKIKRNKKLIRELIINGNLLNSNIEPKLKRDRRINAAFILDNKYGEYFLNKNTFLGILEGF